MKSADDMPSGGRAKATPLKRGKTGIADTDPEEVSYLRFDVQGLAGPAERAALRLWVTNATHDGPILTLVPDTSWTETGITWENRPATGEVIGNVGAIDAGRWLEYDVTALVTGSGPISFAIVGESHNGIDFASREGPVAQRPQLVVEGATTATNTMQRTTMARSAGTTIEESQVDPDALTGTVINTGDGLRCRAEESTDAPILMTIAEGETVVIRGPQEGDWLPITCNGQDGYVSAAYITINQEAETPVDVVPTVAPTEATVPQKPDPTPTQEATPLSVANGWQDDPNVPWWWTTDENPATEWSGAVVDGDDEVEVGYDLGTIQPISHLRWLPTGPLEGTVEIQLSQDGVTWYALTTIDLTRERPDEWREIEVDAPARYINLVVTHPVGGPVGELIEVEVWAEESGRVRPLERLTRIVETTPTPVPTDVPVATEVPTTAPVPTEIPTVEPTPVPLPTDAPPPPTEVPVVIPTEVPAPPPAEEPPLEEAPGGLEAAPPSGG